MNEEIRFIFIMSILFLVPLAVIGFLVIPFRIATRKTNEPFTWTMYRTLLQNFILSLLLYGFQYIIAFKHVKRVYKYGADMALLEDLLRAFTVFLFSIFFFAVLTAINYPICYYRYLKLLNENNKSKLSFPHFRYWLFVIIVLVFCIKMDIINWIHITLMKN